MNKIAKISFVCASLFAFVNAQAQIIESVSFTPAKKGNYRTLATKSVTSFAGNLEVNEIFAHGQKLTLDTGSVVPFNGTTFSVSRDVYMPSATVSGNTSIGSGGKVITTQDSTITNSKVDLIHGGNSDFNKVNGLLTTNGALNIDNVKMSNPKCDIQWIRLPAFTVNNDYFSASPSAAKDFWFAVCGSAAEEVIPEGYWQISHEHATLLGTCTAGWDGSSTSHQDTYHTNLVGSSPCTHGQDSKTSMFICSNQTVTKCTSNVSYGNKLYGTNNNAYSCCNHVSAQIVAYSANWNDTLKCPTIIDKPRPLAEPMYEYTYSNTDVVAPRYCSNWKKYLTQKFRRKFCGFSGTSESAATQNIKDFRHASCTGEDISSIGYCEDLYGDTYTNLLSDEEICVGINSRYPNLINNSAKTFKCIKKGPYADRYSAFRGQLCKDDVETDTTTQCTIANNCPTRCKASDRYFSTFTWTRSRPCQPINFYDNYTRGSCTAGHEGDNTAFTESTAPGGSIVYLEQVVSDGDILVCNWHE